jgi:N,N'-diacetyllegionaminate synthase
MNKTYIIAEIGINHMGDMNKAKQLIDAASRSGVDAVKLQTYITEKRVPLDSPIFDILKKCELPFESFKELKEYCDLKNVEFFSTPFDIESVDYLKSMGITKHKIASFDVTNHSLLKYISNNSDSIIMSTGMANLQEVKEAYSILKKRCHVSLLHCVSAYPTKEVDANLNIIKTLKENFPQCVIGHSDHTPDIKVPLYAVACGAKIIEKHFMIEPDCIDAPVSIDEKQMSLLVKEIRLLEKILGEKVLGMTEAQEGTKIFRRNDGSKII